jgi:hypothetical protein
LANCAAGACFADWPAESPAALAAPCSCAKSAHPDKQIAAIHIRSRAGEAKRNRFIHKPAFHRVSGIVSLFAIIPQGKGATIA